MPLLSLRSRSFPVRVLLTLGGNELDLGDLPSNVHVEGWVSEPDVLAGASVAVGHGGTGTTPECACGRLSASRRSTLWRSAIQRRSHCDLGSGRRGLGRPDPPANSARPRRRALPRHRSGDGGRDADVPIRRRLCSPTNEARDVARAGGSFRGETRTGDHRGRRAKNTNSRPGRSGASRTSSTT